MYQPQCRGGRHKCAQRLLGSLDSTAPHLGNIALADEGKEENRHRRRLYYRYTVGALILFDPSCWCGQASVDMSKLIRSIDQSHCFKHLPTGLRHTPRCSQRRHLFHNRPDRNVGVCNRWFTAFPPLSTNGLTYTSDWQKSPASSFAHVSP